MRDTSKFALIAALLLLVGVARAQPAAAPARVVRCAVVAEIIESGFWQALSERFEKETGIHVEVTSGSDDGIDRAFRQGQTDLITMDAGDTIINLVADGWASDPQPWVRNDMLLVGPPDDPAGIKDMTDASAALKKIVEKKASLLVYSTPRAQQVFAQIAGNTEPDPDHLITLFVENGERQVLSAAASKKAYTLIGRVPFRNGRLSNAGLAAMVKGDPRLRRPFVVAIANPAKVPDAHVHYAWLLSAFLRSAETQQWIAEFGKGKWDDLPMFFPLDSSAPTTRPTEAALVVRGEVEHAKQLELQDLAKMPRTEVEVTDRQGKKVKYSGVALRTIVAQASAPAAGAAMGNAASATFVVARAPDGFRAVFSLVELEHDPANPVLIADHRDGQPLSPAEGPLRVIVPGDARPVRWVRQVRVLEVRQP